MKLLLFYINPKREFDEQSEKLIRIQVDNSLELGWKIEDIILTTNFEYEYSGVKALVVEDDVYCDYSPISTKVTGVLELFKRGLIEDELYWMHDLDAFQLVQILESEIVGEFSLCDYGRLPKWAGGSIFFRGSAKDIFEKIKETMDKHRAVDENALTLLMQENEHIRNRVKKNNISYNFLPYNLRSCYKMALKPLRVAHFHPYQIRLKLGIPRMLDFYKGKNKLNMPLIPERLINIFNKHDVI